MRRTGHERDNGNLMITTVAGTGSNGNTGDGDLATSATLNGPQGVAFDTLGNMFIADSFNHEIRMVTKSDGKITTVVTFPELFVTSLILLLELSAMYMFPAASTATPLISDNCAAVAGPLSPEYPGSLSTEPAAVVIVPATVAVLASLSALAPSVRK